MVYKTLNDLDEEDLKELIREYDIYIQQANEEDLYKNGWLPVCVEEFLNNDFLEILEGKNEYLKTELKGGFKE